MKQFDSYKSSINLFDNISVVLFFIFEQYKKEILVTDEKKNKNWKRLFEKQTCFL